MAKHVYKIIEKRNLWFILSLLVIFYGCGLMVNRAIHSKPVLNFGIDFVGGSSMILKIDELGNRYSRDAEKGISKQDTSIDYVKDVRGALKSIGLDKSVIQVTRDDETVIKTVSLKPQQSFEIQSMLEKTFGTTELLDVDFIGASIGQELREKSLWIILIVTISLLLYITWRFEFSYGVSALIALIHDTLITISFASIMNIEIDTAFVAALLTILGYSINDTIVVFDRIRENMKRLDGRESLVRVANLSIGQTMVRTLNTSLTTLSVIFCLFMFGGTTIQSFCLVLLIGIAAGTYSSVFIASPVLSLFQPKT